MLTLVENGEVFAPAPQGRRSVLCLDGTIAHVGEVDGAALAKLPVPVQVIDARDCVVTPGFVDPHSHLVGTGGEQGYASRTTDVSLEELVQAGVTTVVGCLGTDDIARSLQTLVIRTRQLRAFGLTAYAYTGSFFVPPATITGTVRGDLLLIPEILGVGELAIADFRSNEPSAAELARLTSEALVGGLLGEKAGVVHLHVGPGASRMRVLREVLDGFTVPARHLYPTHIERSSALMDEAIALAHRGAFVDMDTIEAGTGRWIRYYLDHGGPPGQLTLSSDAHAPEATETQYRQRFHEAMDEHGCRFEELLPLFTRNPAEALKLPRKGRIAPGADADLLLLDKKRYRLRTVIARGRTLMRDGALAKAQSEPWGAHT